MTIEDLKKEFQEKGNVRFKLYSLDYIIEMENDEVVIYPTIYKTRKSKYNSIGELLNQYLIYNETILENENNLKKIK